MIGIIFACVSLTAAVQVASAPASVFPDTVRNAIERGQCGFNTTASGQVVPAQVREYRQVGNTIVDEEGLRWVVIEFKGPRDIRLYAPLPEAAIQRGNEA